MEEAEMALTESFMGAAEEDAPGNHLDQRKKYRD
jgi:hypothetical protein